MKEVIVFTHAIDIDGYGCAILAKKAFKNPTIVYAGNNNLDELIKEKLDKGELKKFSQIFITDHCPSLEMCKILNDDKNIAKKIQVFDHHKSRLEYKDIIPWVNVVVEQNGANCCGTSLFYQYLVSQGLIVESSAYKDFVELTRVHDTDWSNAKFPQANNLNNFALAVGREKYVETMAKKLNNTKFSFNAYEKYEIENFVSRYNKDIKRLIRNIEIIDFDGHKAGYIEASGLYKNGLIQEVRKNKNSKNMDFLMINLSDDDCISLRQINPQVDLSILAQKYGGGGHPVAAGFPKANFVLNHKTEIE